MKNLTNYLISFLFLTVILLPVSNDIFGIWEFERKEENRIFKDELEIKFDRLDYFPEECEEYICDNFSFRTPALTLFHQIKFQNFNTSPNKEKIIYGKDNWYFMAAKEQKEVEGKVRFTNTELKIIKQEWERRKDFLDKKGIKYYWVIAPFKHYIYPEFLPETVYQSNKPKRVEQLEEVMKADFPTLIINPIESLLSEKENYRLFAQLDNHWSYRAGEIVTNELIKRLKKDFPNQDFPSLTQFEWNDSVIKEGNHYKMLNIQSLSEIQSRPNLENSHAIKKENYGFRNDKKYPQQENYEERYMSQQPKSSLRILLIRDSFGKAIIPFISDYFAESLFIFDDWKYYLNEQIIETYKPDVVVFLNLETHTDSYLNNHTTR